MSDSEAPDRDVETRLIRAGMRETPPSGTLQRTLTGLGLGASALATASSVGALGAAKAAAPVTVMALAKWASLGAVSGVMLTAAAYGVEHATRPATRATPSSLAARQASAAATPVSSAVAHEPLVVASSRAPVLPSTAASPPPAPVPIITEMDVPLATELAFVDRGREAFQRNDAGAALTLLDSYERSFPELRLVPEVLYLRMRAHHQRGETERAAKLAERLVRDFPRSPHVSSARSILQATPAH